MSLQARLRRLEHRIGATEDAPCTCDVPIVEVIEGDDVALEPDTGTHCPVCGGRLPRVRLIEVVLPKEDEP